MRKSCDSAERIELRKRSETISTLGTLRDFDIVDSLNRYGDQRGHRLKSLSLCMDSASVAVERRDAMTPRTRIGAFNGK